MGNFAKQNSEKRKVYKVGTRTSPLALKQGNEVIARLKAFYPGIGFKIVGIDTYGDKDRLTPISDIEGTNFFTREIEEAILDGEIDFAVHSAKDMPDEIPEGLCIAAITESIDPHDALVSKDNLKLDELPHGAKVGTSSLRRKSQLRSYRNDFEIVDIRGNIEERLEMLDKTALDGIIIAACGLKRLGLEDRIAQRVPFEILRPHPLQGALAIEARKNDDDTIDLVRKMDRRANALA